MLLKTILIMIALGVFIFLSYRKKVIERKMQTINLSEEEEKELWILAHKCLEKAYERGIKLPKKCNVIRLDSDPYTWVILKLGIKDKEIFRCRMTIEEMAEAKTKAKEGT